jgi:hypothetical protein
MMILLLTLVLAAPQAAQTVDRILAVVSGDPILLSDVSAALRLGLVPPPPEGADPVRAGLDALIDRRLELAETARYLPPEPPDEAVQARYDEVRRRVDSEEGFERVLRGTGMTADQLRQRLRDDLRIRSYLEQRFGGLPPPGDQQVEAYYRSHADDFRRNGVLPPLASVRADVRARLIEEQRETLVHDWLAGLRRRGAINDLYLPAK